MATTCQEQLATNVILYVPTAQLVPMELLARIMELKPELSVQMIVDVAVQQESQEIIARLSYLAQLAPMELLARIVVQ